MSEPMFPSIGRAFAGGDVLFNEGDVGNVMFVIQSGRVRISRRFSTGDRTLAVLGPGEFFGEMAILNAKPRTATATVLEDLRALVIDARTFESMVTGNTEIAVRLIQKLSRRLDAANTFIDILLQHDPRIRVLLGLSRVADEFGQRTDAGVLIPVSAAELAHEVGLPEAEVSSVLQRLAQVRVVTHVSGDHPGWLVDNLDHLRDFVALLGTRRTEGD